MFVEEDDNLGTMEGWNKENKNEEDFLNNFGTEKEEAEKEDATSYPDIVESLIDASFDVLWNLLVEKVHHPEKYLPVEDVGVEHRDGKWVRHMYLAAMELVITEEISINEEDHTIRFVDNNYPDLEIVNAIETTDNPNKQRISFYKQERETGARIANKQLVQIFTTDLHFLKFRAAQKMSRAMHSREPSYGGVASFVGVNGVALGHARDISYGGVEDSNFLPARQAPQQHAREMSYGGIRTLFEEQDGPQLMAKLQEEVFRVMDVYEWSQITKGMIVQEVEEVLGFKLKEHHKRFIKITIMRIIDGKLKLECFAGETVKKEVFNAERQRVVVEAEKHKRDISYGGVQEMFDEAEEWERKEEELDRLYSKAQERELDQLYTKAQDNSISAQAVIGGGFKTGKKTILRDKEKEEVRRTQRHSRNVSYGAVHYSELDQEQEQDENEPEVNIVKNTGFTQQIQGLTAEITGLKKEFADLQMVNENMKVSKLLLAQTCSSEIERLRGIINSLS